VHVNHYDVLLLHAVIDLVNEPPTSPTGLNRRWLDAGLPVEDRPDTRDLSAVQEYLQSWSLLIDADTEQARVAQLNMMLARYTTHPIVTGHDGSQWHLHFRPDDASFSGILTAACTAAIARYLTDRGVQRLGRCALPECSNAYLDHSRPGRQRYCCHTCANRDAVRRHRKATAGANRPVVHASQIG